MKELRWYQEKAITMTRQEFSKGLRKIMIWLATGGGKSVIFGQIAHNLRKNNKKIIFVVRRKQLVHQAMGHFKSWNIDCAPIMAGMKIDPTAEVQVCSIDTIRSRIKKPELAFLKDFDAVIVDECHDCTAASYMGFFDFLGDKIYIGLTATPFEVGKKIHDFWDSCVKPIEVHELRDEGFLTDAAVYLGHSADTSNLKVQANGDFKNQDAFDVMKNMKVIGDIVSEYEKHGQDKAAILFAVNVKHSIMMEQAFNDAGIPAIHCDATTPQKERDEAIRKLSNGKIKVLCNVNIFSTGVDIPQAEIGIMARPTASEILYIQQLGRLLRPFKVCRKCKTERGAEDSCYKCGSKDVSYEKNKATILDHGENTMRFGLPFDVRSAMLTEKELEEKKKKEPKESDGVKVIKARECTRCFAVNELSSTMCSECGSILESENIVKVADGVMIKVTPDGFLELQKRNANNTRNQLISTQLLRDFKPIWVDFQLCKRFKNTPRAIEGIVPKWMYNKLLAGELKL